jgi:hypothetical protein
MQHELDHLDGKLYIDYLESPDELLPVGVGDDDADGDAADEPAGARTAALA